MTVYILHAPQDRPAAEALERFLERRGHFVEPEEGARALRPVMGADVAIMLVSKDLVFSPYRLQLEKRALEAWAENRLVLIKLDKSFAPVGLRDLPSIDASFEAQREFTWIEVDRQIREKLAPRREEAAQEQSQVATGGAAPPPMAAPAPAQLERTRSAGPQAPPATKRGGGGALGVLFGLLLLLPGLAALGVTTSIFLANRIGPSPGAVGELIGAIDAFGVRYGAPAGGTVPAFIAALAVLVVSVLMLVAAAISSARRPKARAVTRAAPAKPKPYPKTEDGALAEKTVVLGAAESDAVFVSYARANSSFVMPVIEGAKQVGRKFWIDAEAVSAGESWAGEIVRAIRTAQEVCVMCSKAAFDSDHVKREVYLADRYKKRLVPVFIEEVAPPEDFEYFFASVQGLNLYATPEADRPAALVRALAAA
jgi:TIR domain